MATYNDKPEKAVILVDPEKIAAYAHPTRMNILSLLAGKAATLTMTAKRLGTRPANISRHFKRLEETGLIELVETKTTAKNIEKYYRATALSFVVGSENVSTSDKSVLALSILREELTLAAGRAREGARGEHLVLISLARIASPMREEFRTRLQELIREFGSCSDPSGDAYTLAVAMFPSAETDLGAQEITL
jgi:DNA-binding transcriptional ArsR family regulator